MSESIASKYADTFAMEDAVLKLLEEPFDAAQVRTRQGRGGIELKWVDARTVAQRLDAVLGLSGWDWHIERQQDGVVLGTLTIHLPTGATVVRQDWGYMTGGSGEDLKEAASDCLRRCASLFGVGRYLYQHGAADASSVSNATQTRQVAVNQSVPRAPQAVQDAQIKQAAEEMFGSKDAVKATLESLSGSDGGSCPTHALPWTLKPAGVSKAGKAYNAFYTCTGRNADNSYCSMKPPIAWLAKNKPGAQAQDAVKLVPQELEELPF
jgi:hypothetical protein